jgi:hypothetical protein
VSDTIEAKPHRADKTSQFVLTVEKPADNVDCQFFGFKPPSLDGKRL